MATAVERTVTKISSRTRKAARTDRAAGYQYSLYLKPAPKSSPPSSVRDRGLGVLPSGQRETTANHDDFFKNADLRSRSV